MTLLLLSLLLLLCSLLVHFHLGHPLLWKISLAATEYGHRFAILPILLLLYSPASDAVGTMTRIAALLTIIALLYPSLRAAVIASSVRDAVDRSFGTHTKITPYFSWRRLLFGRAPAGDVPVHEVYARHGNEEQYLLFHPAHRSTPAPCIIIFHTGGWDSGSPAEFPAMSRFLSRSGYAVASISYRFAPRWPWPAQREDALAAIAYLKLHAQRLGIDAERLVLFGRSAGGQIAAAAATTANDRSIKGCIAFYAPADMIFAYEHLPVEPDILDSRTLLHHYLGGPLQERMEQYRNASPFHSITPNTPPMLLIHGTKDPLTWYRQSERFSQELSRHAVPHCYIELPWGTHAFDYNYNGPGGQLSRSAVLCFLSSVVPLKKTE